MAIQSLADKATEKFFNTGQVAKGAGWSNVAAVAKRKLDMLEYAALPQDLKIPPNSKLEALKRDLTGFHGIRINDQWRVVFRWTEAGPAKVRITDYY